MKKSIIIITLLALVALTGQAKIFKTYQHKRSQPKKATLQKVPIFQRLKKAKNKPKKSKK